MLGELAGRAHEVLTAVALAGPHGVTERLSSSMVRFRKIAPEECVAYWETGERGTRRADMRSRDSCSIR